MSKAVEVNYDGLVGPTHNYAGLAYGNLASQQFAETIANPKAAALEGLAKMQRLMELGLVQGVLPPQSRPNLALLKQLGFTGNNEQLLKKAYQYDKKLLATVYSAANMWTANAATVTPSADSADGKVHFTPANLQTNLHRYQESQQTGLDLQTIFSDQKYFHHHAPLPAIECFADEGAANHLRFCQDYGDTGLECFVYGRESLGGKSNEVHKFPARQCLEASQAVARLHQLTEDNVLFLKQNPAVIDQGVFHNDVISVANKHVFLFHEEAFVNSREVLELLNAHFDGQLSLLTVRSNQISVAEAVKTYLFNSQLVSIDETKMALIAPTECEESSAVKAWLEECVASDNPISQVHYVNCRQSMQNGGGPACLRLRVVLTEEELAASHSGVLLNDALHQRLTQWIEKYYRDRLAPEDLLDPSLIDENEEALEALKALL